MRVCLLLSLALVAFAVEATAQQAAPQNSEYVLGPNDEIVIIAVDAEEIANKPVRIGIGGDINLPMVGRIRASGLMVQQLENEIAERLKVYIRRPQVSLSVTQFRSQPATVLGAVRNPGVVQLEGRKTLVEVLSMAGGAQNDASSKVTITRHKEAGTLPLVRPVVKEEPLYFVGEVDMRSIIDGSHPELNIQILPNDVITVPRAPIVYAVGFLNKQGGFVLNDKDAISILQLVAMAGGTIPTANTKQAKVIRPVPGSTRIELPVNVKDIMSGKAKDMMLQAEDILYVPDSYAKGALRRTLDTAVTVTTGMAIYR